MKLPLSGGCLCGSVRYEISAPPKTTANCHCRTCQRAVGAAYLPILFVPTPALAVTGHFKEFPTLAGSGNTVYRAFCPKCGTSLFGRNSAFTQLRPVSAATLDDPSEFKPEKDTWVGDAQPWDYMNPELPKCKGNFWES